MANASTAPCPLISGITIDFSRFKTDIESAQVRIGASQLRIDAPKGRRSLQHTFPEPMMLSQGDTFSLYMDYIDTSQCLEKKRQMTILEPDDIFRANTNSEREYIWIDKKITITIKLSRNTTEITEQFGSPDESLELQPTTGTSEISQIGPRFRILVAGKAGVGKSTLIHRAFGVETAFPSSDKAGKADIEHEFIPPKNDRLVIHDSNGFEAADEENLKTVRDFIDHRRNMSPEHQLHAIWLCFQIPSAGGRFLDTGTEDLLESNGMLGNVPIIAVFTKYDLLIDRMDRSLDETSIDVLSDEAIRELVKKNAEAELQDICIGPLNQLAGPDIPYAKISTDRGYEETLIHLIELTERYVAEHSALQAAVMSSMTRRIQPRLNIEASIDVGKTRYRKTLSLGTIFMKHKMRDCLYVLHTDIVNVWNLRDSHHYLFSPEFRALMAEVRSTKGYRHFSLGPSGLQRFMSYIVDLTLVLQTLYLVSESHEVTRRAIKLAVKSYIASPMSEDVRIRIQDYDRKLTILERMDRDTLNKLAEVMQFSSIDAVQVPDRVDLSLDEPWTIETS